MVAQERRTAGTGPQPEDDIPSDEMVKLARAGGLSGMARIIPREAAVPAPDMVDRIEVAVIDSAEGNTPSYVFALNGANDPVMKEIADRYGAAAKGAKKSKDERAADLGALLMEVCAAKRAAGQDPIDPAEVVAPAPGVPPVLAGNVSSAPSGIPFTAKRKAAVQITFDLGPAGKMIGRYSDVSIQGHLLVLVADATAVEAGLYLPPSTGTDGDPILVTIPNLDVPVPVFSVDLVFQHAGSVFCLLLIDRDPE